MHFSTTTIAILTTLTTVIASPTPQIAELELENRAAPAPKIRYFEDWFTTNDSTCSATSRPVTEGYGYGVCNTLFAGANSWKIYAPEGTTAYLYSNGDCTGHLTTQNPSDQGCKTAAVGSGPVRSFIVPLKDCGGYIC